ALTVQRGRRPTSDWSRRRCASAHVGSRETAAPQSRSLGGQWMEASMLLFLKNALFTVVVPGTVGVIIPYRIGLRRTSAGLPWDAQHYAALFLLAVGGAIYFRCVWDFARIGRGTPAPIDAPQLLVVRGLYNDVRHPIY